MTQTSLEPAAVTNGVAGDTRHDRRLLGRLLGEVVQEQLGQTTLDLIEHVRQTAVRFRRAEFRPEDASEKAAARSATITTGK